MAHFDDKHILDHLYTRNPSRGSLANSENADEMLQNVTFHQGMHCLPKSIREIIIHHVVASPFKTMHFMIFCKKYSGKVNGCNFTKLTKTYRDEKQIKHSNIK